MITYETNNTHPGTLPYATIYMNGLLCLCLDHANKCTVAVNNMVGNEHKWKCLILDRDSGRTILDLKQGKTQSFWEEIHIDVTGGTTQGTYVYNGSPVLIPTGKEHRYNLESSWVDLEGPRGHNTKLENDKNTLWPRFYINEGLFCASKKSEGKFDLRDTNSRPLIKPLGQVAVDIVADIFLDRKNRDSKIEVKLPHRTYSLKNSRTGYQIYITSHCESVVGREGDFHLHYNAFRGAFDDSKHLKTAHQFHLVPHGSKVVLQESSLTQDVEYPDPYSDKVPCMSVGFGQTSTFTT